MYTGRTRVSGCGTVGCGSLALAAALGLNNASAAHGRQRGAKRAMQQQGVGVGPLVPTYSFEKHSTYATHNVTCAAIGRVEVVSQRTLCQGLALLGVAVSRELFLGVAGGCGSACFAIRPSASNPKIADTLAQVRSGSTPFLRWAGEEMEGCS
ncbi:hypothetical protein MSAN_01926300 [Mycena sanguinolenta]|uniref:Uncharacterized protein n=1 Tax=Mycena sanguinolenta TaxID=230812 RepID=A0A8H6XMI6_9AGAR|nr:hypothetical protein MSAN_01926300 [Mycena sanguinolenta]